MVEKLYGVMHGKHLDIAGMRVADSDTKPGNELTKELLSLPPNTSIGIEHAPELDAIFEIDGVPVTTGVNSNYWKEIEKICKSKHLNVIHLEDFPTYKKFTQKVIEARTLDEDLLKRNVKFRNAHPNERTDKFEENSEIKKLLRKIYKTQIESEYIFVVEREQKMLDKIAEQKPQVVILGKGHTDYVILKPEELTSRKIPLGKYIVEDRISKYHWQWSEEAYDQTTLLIQNPLPDENELLERELLIRRHRAVTEGRIMPNRTPDFIGTWDLVIPARGLFEIYLNKKDNLVGRIEDTLGTATFNGSITDKKVIFAKNYNQKKSSSEAIGETIMYTGNGSNDLYIGDFKVASGYAADRQMPFAMKKYSKSSRLNLV